MSGNLSYPGLANLLQSSVMAPLNKFLNTSETAVSTALGAMAAAQLMATARREVDGLDAALGRGELAPLLAWLRQRVHTQGSRLGFNELLEAATGKPLDPADFEAHLTRRYLDHG